MGDIIPPKKRVRLHGAPPPPRSPSKRKKPTVSAPAMMPPNSGDSFVAPATSSHSTTIPHTIHTSLPQQTSSQNASMDELNRQSHAHRLSQEETLKEDKKTMETYARHLKAYETFWEELQRKEKAKDPKWVYIPAHPIMAVKVAVFMKYEESRPKKRSRGGEIKGSTLGPSHIKQVISALEYHRHHHQHEDVYRNCPDAQKGLRSDARITTFEQTANSQVPKRVSEAQVLKAKGSIADCYTKPELIRMSMSCLTSFHSDTYAHVGIRDRAMLLVSTTTALRGDNTRAILWSDLLQHDVPMPDISPDTTINALVIMSNQGKTNVNGRLEEHGVFRHRHPELCCIGGLALYFFSYFHILNKDLPDFEPDFDSDDCGELGRREWWKILVFPGGAGETEQMSYENHHKRVSIMHENNDVDITKVTHAGRIFTTMIAREYNADANEVKAHGGWGGGSSYEACYDRRLPTKAMMGAAMFNATSQQNYILPRGKLEPPAELLQMIFPWVERELALYQRRRRRLGPHASDIALREFLRNLQNFRLVLLQDAAVLYEKYPSAYFYNFPPFNTPSFREFATQSPRILATTAQQSCNSCLKAPVNLRGALQAGFQEFYLDQSRHQVEAQRDQTRLEGGLQYVTSLVEVIPLLASALAAQQLGALYGHVSLQSNATTVTTATPTVPTPTLTIPTHDPPQQTSLLNPELAEIDSVIDDPTWDILRPTFTLSIDHVERKRQVAAIHELVQKFGAQRLGRHTFEWVRRSGSLSDEWLPLYELKLHSTLEEIWTEQTLGLDGQFSVTELEAVWHARWRRNLEAQKTIATRRKKIITLIEDLAKKPNWNTDLALRFLNERFPISPKGPGHLRSVRQFCGWLQKTDSNAKNLIFAEADSYGSRRS